MKNIKKYLYKKIKKIKFIFKEWNIRENNSDKSFAQELNVNKNNNLDDTDNKIINTDNNKIFKNHKLFKKIEQRKD